jgi:ABC-type nitrate/sulfonate/bicarbonate transport system permease component
MTWLAAALATAAAAAAVAVAAPACAEPEDHVPSCSGDQTPMDNNCRVSPSQVFTHVLGPGANPEVPLGTGSGEALPN